MITPRPKPKHVSKQIKDNQIKDNNRTEKILNQMIEDLDLVIIKAKAQLDYIDGDELSDMMRDER